MKVRGMYEKFYPIDKQLSAMSNCISMSMCEGNINKQDMAFYYSKISDIMNLQWERPCSET